MKRILVLITLVLLSSCTLFKKQLATPTNLRIIDKMLYWDNVENATKYRITIGTTNYNSNSTQFDLSEITPGEHTVTVTALADGYRESKPSEVLKFVIEATVAVPTGLTITNNILTWAEVENATKYTVMIDDETVEVNINQYDLSSLIEKESYTIKVKAHVGDKESDYSTQITYQPALDVYKSFTLQFNKNTSADVEVSFGEELNVSQVLDEDENVISESGYTLSDTKITFLNSYLQTCDYGDNRFILNSNKGKVLVKITITDDRKPKILSADSVTYTGEDLTFTFELYSGFIDSVNITVGDEISDSDYEIVDNQLIIYKEFIDRIFNQNSERERIILGYQLRANNHIVVGYLFINRA